MHVRTFLLRAAVLAGALSTMSASAVAQRDVREWQQDLHDWVDQCRSWGDNDSGDRYRVCDVRQQTMPASGRTIAVDAGENGGISVTAWDGDSVLIGAKVQASAPSDAEAKEIASQVHIVRDGGRIRAEGPAHRSRTSWSVSFELLVPRRSDLSLDANNGGIHVADVQGRMELSTTNGGIHLDGVGGNVHGHTTNGGLDIRLSGQRWSGDGLNVTTTNGGVRLQVPRDYSAQLETGTVNGGMNIDFPVTVQGRIGRRLSAQLGAGGPTIRATTTNGGVSIRRG